MNKIVDCINFYLNNIVKVDGNNKKKHDKKHNKKHDKKHNKKHDKKHNKKKYKCNNTETSESSNSTGSIDISCESILYFTDHNSIINYILPSKNCSYINIITNINNFSSLIENDPLRGVNGIVYAIVADEIKGILYIGGTFTLVGSINASYIVSYNIITGIFTPLTDSVTGKEGTNNNVLSLALDTVNSKLYLGGEFTNVGETITASRIACWDILNSKFLPLTDTVTLGEGADDAVRCLALNSNNSKLYLGGEISSVGGTIVVKYIASWNILTNTFSPLIDSITGLEGTNASVYSLVYDSVNSKLCIGGAFTNVGGTIQANYIAFWNVLNNTFSALIDTDTLINGTNSSVYSLAYNPINNTLYVGGSFDLAGGKMNQWITSYNINNSSWICLEGGIQKIDDSLNPIVNTLCLDIVNQILYVGGNYLQTSGINTNNVSVYNINNNLWSPLTENKGRYNGITNGYGYYNVLLVKSIYKFNNFLFIGGNFNMGGNIPVNNITKVKLNYILNTDGSKIFINNTSTILKYNSSTNKWIIIY
jgi:hypothetical protein